MKRIHQFGLVACALSLALSARLAKQDEELSHAVERPKVAARPSPTSSCQPTDASSGSPALPPLGDRAGWDALVASGVIHPEEIASLEDSRKELGELLAKPDFGRGRRRDANYIACSLEWWASRQPQGGEAWLLLARCCAAAGRYEDSVRASLLAGSQTLPGWRLEANQRAMMARVIESQLASGERVIQLEGPPLRDRWVALVASQSWWLSGIGRCERLEKPRLLLLDGVTILDEMPLYGSGYPFPDALEKSGREQPLTSADTQEFALLDVTGDGRPEVVTRLEIVGCGWDPQMVTVLGVKGKCFEPLLGVFGGHGVQLQDLDRDNSIEVVAWDCHGMGPHPDNVRTPEIWRWSGSRFEQRNALYPQVFDTPMAWVKEQLAIFPSDPNYLWQKEFIKARMADKPFPDQPR